MARRGCRVYSLLPAAALVPKPHAGARQGYEDAAIEPALGEPFVSIDGRDFTLAEFMTTVGTFGGWGMRIEFVPDDELHQRPKLKVQEPKPRKEDFTKEP